jgi:crotonobetainyl-CoA:carnitine CoA-transferase CaiB-like acyl-CoA transferase
VRSAPPLLGEHTAHVLGGDLGMSRDDIGTLIASGVVKCA